VPVAAVKHVAKLTHILEGITIIFPVFPLSLIAPVCNLAEPSFSKLREIIILMNDYDTSGFRWRQSFEPPTSGHLKRIQLPLCFLDAMDSLPNLVSLSLDRSNLAQGDVELSQIADEVSQSGKSPMDRIEWWYAHH
jgi:hypothetical protein